MKTFIESIIIIIITIMLVFTISLLFDVPIIKQHISRQILVWLLMVIVAAVGFRVIQECNK